MGMNSDKGKLREQNAGSSLTKEHENNDLEGRQVRVGPNLYRFPRSLRSPIERVVVFAVVPSLLAWTIILLLVTGQGQAAIQVGCTAVAAGYVGWHLCDVWH